MAKVLIKKINKTYGNGVNALKDFDLEIKDKEFVVLLGPSGCGKTTLLRVFSGLDEATSGEIYVNEKRIDNIPPVDRKTSMVFQNYALYPNMTVFQNIAFPLNLKVAKFPLYEIDDSNPQYIEEIDEIESRINEEKNKLIQDVKNENIKRFDKKVKINEIKEILGRKLSFELYNLEKKYSKQVMTFDEEETTKLEAELKELKKQKNINNEAIKTKELEIDKAYEKKVKPAFVKRRLTQQEISAKVSETAKMLGLYPYLSRTPKSLSGGQRQRVALGRAIVKDPEIFLMDEPLSNLDSRLRTQLRSEILKIHKSLGTITIFVTHDQTEAMTMADKIVIMKDGEIQQIGSPKDIYNHPENLFVAGFIGSPTMNLIQGTFINSEFNINSSEQKIKLPKEICTLLQPYIGKDITLGVRPEDVKISQNIQSSSLKLTCDSSELTGKDLIIYCYLNSNKISVCVDQDIEVVAGEEKAFEINLEKAHFFDNETGKRII